MTARAVSLQAYFFAESAQALAALRRLLGGDGAETRREMCRLLHGLNGAARTVGLENVAAQARALETQVADGATVEVLAHGLAALQATLSAAGGGECADARRVALRFRVGQALVGAEVLWRRALGRLRELGRLCGPLPDVQAGAVCELQLETGAADSALHDALASLAEPGSVTCTPLESPAPTADSDTVAMQVFGCAGMVFALPVRQVRAIMAAGTVCVVGGAVWAPPSVWWPHGVAQARENIPLALLVEVELETVALGVETVGAVEHFAASALRTAPQALRERWPLVAGVVVTNDGRQIWQPDTAGALRAAKAIWERATLAALRADVVLAQAKGVSTREMVERVEQAVAALDARTGERTATPV